MSNFGDDFAKELEACLESIEVGPFIFHPPDLVALMSLLPEAAIITLVKNRLPSYHVDYRKDGKCILITRKDTDNACDD